MILATHLNTAPKYIIKEKRKKSKHILIHPPQDTGYIVEKTYLDIAPYWGPFGAYLMPQ